MVRCSPVVMDVVPSATGFFVVGMVVSVNRREQRRCDLTTDVRIEPVPGEQGVCALPPLTWIGDPGQRSGVPGEQPIGGEAIRAGAAITRLAIAASRRCRVLPTLGEDVIGDGPVDALAAQLVTDRALAARVRAIAGLHPGARERVVIEHPQFGQALDRPVDEVGAIAGRRETTADFGHRTRPDLQEPCRRLKDDGRIVDRRVAFATLRVADPALGRHDPSLGVRQRGHKAVASTDASALCGA